MNKIIYSNKAQIFVLHMFITFYTTEHLSKPDLSDTGFGAIVIVTRRDNYFVEVPFLDLACPPIAAAR